MKSLPMNEAAPLYAKNESAPTDYNIGKMLEVFQIVHNDRFNRQWIEYHHPRLTRMYYNAIRTVPDNIQIATPHTVKELETMMFSWLQ